MVLPDGQAITFHDQVRQPLDCYAMSGLVFKKRGRLPAHVRVVWGERWLPTPPTEAVGRMPSRCGLRRLSATCLTCPDCMARLWVLLVAAYAWLLVWGMTLATGGKPSHRSVMPTVARVANGVSFEKDGRRFVRATSPPLVVSVALSACGEREFKG